MLDFLTVRRSVAFMALAFAALTVLMAAPAQAQYPVCAMLAK